ncbi:MAG: molybdate transport system substrate-binding protein [Janthinobacterium sp.]|jgi:molybdate transport system substrate-binding protein
MRYTAVCKWMAVRLAAIVLAMAGGAAVAGPLLVSAAASLTNAFADVVASYQQQYPDASVALNFAASGVLLQQIDKGAPVDVFASADQQTMDLAQQRGLTGMRHDFARNSLVVIVPKTGSVRIAPAHLSRLAHLQQDAVSRIAIGNPAIVPAGAYTRRALSAAQLWPLLQSKTIQTYSVRQALDYVARGEVDAGFVYRTDAALMPDKVSIAFGVAQNERILYPIAAIKSSANGAEALRFIGFIRSAAGQAILAKHGFLPP